MLNPAELVGYLASALIVVSLMMSSLLRLRVVNLAGSAVFSVYAVLIGSVPVLLTNVAILAINVHHLRRLWRDRNRDAYFEVVDVEPASNVLRRFVAVHADDIARFQPTFDGVRDDHLAWMILRDGVSAGAVLARRTGEAALHLDLDYVTEAHRDFTPGAVLFGASGALQRAGAARVTTDPGTSAHQRYLERMGFAPANGEYVREMSG